MEVKLLNSTTKPLELIYTACRTCYSADTPIDIYNKEVEDNKKISLISKVFDSGHLSTSEHVNFSFALCGVSRALLAQITRHRLCSFSVQSQRYVEIKEKSEEIKLLRDFGTEIDKMRMINKYFVLEHYSLEEANALLFALIVYRQLIENGMKVEDARMYLPNCTKTNIVMSMNLREFMHLCNLRLCKHAQAEIRKAVGLMRDSVLEKKEYSWLKKYLVPNCKNCTDFRDCREV